MFLQNISYDFLSLVRSIIIIVFLVIMFVTTLRETRKWVCLAYVILGLILTIVCILAIPKEIVADKSYNVSIIIGILAATCTAIWSIRFGNNLIFKSREESEEE